MGRYGGRSSGGHSSSRSSGRKCGGRSRSYSSGRSSRSFSASTKSFVSGKIAGQYRAKGYSKSCSQHIGNVVVGKMRSTFRSGRGSTRSYRAGIVTGTFQGTRCYSLSRFNYIGNTVAQNYPASFVNSSTRSNNLFATNSKALKAISYGKKYEKSYK